MSTGFSYKVLDPIFLSIIDYSLKKWKNEFQLIRKHAEIIGTYSLLLTLPCISEHANR